MKGRRESVRRDGWSAGLFGEVDGGQFPERNATAAMEAGAPGTDPIILIRIEKKTAKGICQPGGSDRGWQCVIEAW